MPRHRLILVRHAKSSWDTAALRDHDRPLKRRGQRDCRLVGAFLRDELLLPGEVVLSTALRCIETWDGIREAAELDVDARRDGNLYHAGAAGMLDILRAAAGDVVLMIGHNPGIAGLASGLVADPGTVHADFRRYPTSATTVLDFDVDSWRQVNAGTGALVTFRIPRELRA